MIESLVLVEGQNVSAEDQEALRSLSLANAKQLVIGNVYGFGVILDIYANTAEDLVKAISDFAKISGARVVTLALRADA